MNTTNSAHEHNWFVGSISVVENHQSSQAGYYHSPYGLPTGEPKSMTHGSSSKACTKFA